jgi:hypothetical protein
LIEHANISLRVPSRTSRDGVRLDIDGHNVNLSAAEFRSASIEVAASWLPDYIRFLGELPNDDTPLKFALSNRHWFTEQEPIDLRIDFESDIVRQFQSLKIELGETPFEKA